MNLQTHVDRTQLPKSPRIQTRLTTGSRERSSQPYRASTLSFGDGSTLQTRSDRPGVRFQYPKQVEPPFKTWAQTNSEKQLTRQTSANRPTTILKTLHSRNDAPRANIRIDERANRYHPVPKVSCKDVPFLFMSDAEFEQIRIEVFSPFGQDVYRLGKAPTTFDIN